MPDKYMPDIMEFKKGWEKGYNKGLKDGVAKWHDIEFEPVPKEGYYLVCFCNWPQITIAEWRGNEDEGGTFYYPDTDKTFLSIGLIVEAWMELPKPMHVEKFDKAEKSDRAEALLVLVSFQVDCLKMAKANWCESQFHMLERLFTAVALGKPYDYEDEEIEEEEIND